MSTPIDVDPDAGLVRLKLAPGTDPDGSASWFALTDMVRELRPKSAFEAAPLPALPALKFTAPLSKRQPVVDHRAWSRAPAVEKFLIRELTALDGLCRSGHGTGPHAKEACDEADDIMDYLSAAGWLYGRVTQHEADPRWWNVNTSSLPLSDRP